jgi:hypothetical protein
MRVAVCSSLVVFSTFLAASAMAQAPAPPPGSAAAQPPPGAAPPAYGPPPGGPPPPGYYYAPPPPPSDDLRYPLKNAGIYINPLAFLFGFFGAEVDFKVASIVTVNIGGTYYHRSITLLGDTTTTTAYGGDVGAQIFPLGRAFNQLYVYPRVSFLGAKATETFTTSSGTTESSASAKLLGLGATVGYQWTYNPGFSVRLGGGVMYYTVAAKDDGNADTISLDGVLPALDASIGWTF